MNATEIAHALAEHAEAVCRHYLPAGRRQGRYWIIGGIDGAKGHSLFVRLSPPGTPGKWTDAATGEHGDLLDLIRIRSSATSLRDTLAEARKFLLLPAPATNQQAPDLPTDAATTTSIGALRLWRLCRPIHGSHAETYLNARGITRTDFASLRFHPALHYRDNTGHQTFPALVCAATSNEDTITGVHRTWLHPDTPVKAKVADPRKALGRIHGHAVRFGQPDPGGILIVGEGIETVLSLVTAVPNVAAAAALSATHLAAFDPPPDIQRLVIALDADPAGNQAAAHLQERCSRMGIHTMILTPDRGDFNDDLKALGAPALSVKLDHLREVRAPATSQIKPAS